MRRHIARYGLTAIGICVGMTIVIAQSGSDAAGQRGRGEDVGGPVTVTGCLIEFSNTSSTSDSASASSSTGSPAAGASSPNSSSQTAASQSSLTTVREQFVLANARPASASSSAKRPAGNTDTSVPGGAGASGTAGSGETPQSATGGATTPATKVAPSASGSEIAKTATRYLIVGLQTDELRKHVMHQVEVSGIVDPPDTPSGSASRSASSASGAGDTTSRVVGSADRNRDLRRLRASSIRTIAQACTPGGSQE